MRLSEPELLYHVYVKDAKHFQKTEDTYDHWALFIVEEGSFDYRMGGLSERATKGDMVLCPPELTFYRQTNGLSFHLAGFRWKTAGEAEVDARSASFPQGILRLLNHKRMQSTLSLLREARLINAGAAHEYKSHLLRDLLYAYQVESFHSESGLLHSENPLLQLAIHKLRQQADSGVGGSLKSIARELGISQVQLTRLFKGEFKLTPSAYSANLRMEKVKLLLAHSSLTLAQIAEQCGFTDEHHLSKSFKKWNGINPSAYRKAYAV
ncbi:helix-turn-helix domain-containing protein [Paenibacillus sp. 2TAB23]|uniref:helix-turn-helix domain-containing protein n=1 Tax=Paenibacillus sp. 2TAB23 TaxID=3233004 RepID=UPI003F95DE70